MKGSGSVDCLLQAYFQALGDFLIQKDHGWAGRGSLHRYLVALMAHALISRLLMIFLYRKAMVAGPVGAVYTDTWKHLYLCPRLHQRAAEKMFLTSLSKSASCGSLEILQTSLGDP